MMNEGSTAPASAAGEPGTAPALDRYAVLGNPVEHSQSPFIHAAFAAQTAQAVRYERLLCPLDGFEQTVRAFAASGARGCNITVPFKFEAPALVARCSPRARLAQAANTLCFNETGWLADNTDGLGLVADIQRNAGRVIAGCRLLLIGAGGASAGVLGPLIEARPLAVHVVNRTVSRAQELIARHQSLAEVNGVLLSAAGLEDCGGAWDIVINGSSSSLQGVHIPVPGHVLKPGALAVDMMYGPKAQGFLQWAQAQGAQGRDGLGMLVEQAAAAFEVWRGVRPLTAPVLRALREKLQAV